MNLVPSLDIFGNWCEETRFTRIARANPAPGPREESRISGNLRGRDSLIESRAGTGILAPLAGDAADKARRADCERRGL